MPVKKNPNGNDWCFGSKCGFKTKKDAEAVERAYYSAMNKKSINICNTDLAKSVNEEKRIFKCVALRPNQFDNDGRFEDFYSEDTVEKAAHQFLMFCNQANIGHSNDNTELIKFVESHVSEIDYRLGDGDVLRGDWVLAAKIFDDEIWEKCKKGEYTGFSIGCKALVEEIDE